MSSSWSPFRTHVKKVATEQLAITQRKGTRFGFFMEHSYGEVLNFLQYFEKNPLKKENFSEE